ncbi:MULTISPECIES: YDG domain-containing protein [unclassified Massilia]|uniref:YDG domain-containing protein n=1 Tax=unclassified Massilia TaxID=2609279 RepID=UPI00177FEFF6|nr:MULTISPECIES: YDG domain-containing protein [unclassified Massilia]MBD8528353.1 caspase family protein [Massilia sp. CFBP 13647]MBD8672025.1 caspase family protein [Massilia sp. CFBP 13721]
MKQCSSLPAFSPRPGLARHALAASIAAAFGTAVAPAWAQVPQLPTGAQVVSGTAGISTGNGQMTVTNSPNAVIDWNSFSIGAEYGVHFQQQSAASKVLNRVVGTDPSNIFGSLSSNGAVWLINPNGMLFGSGARVNVAGLVASTLPLSTSDFLAGQYRFGGGGTAPIRTEPGSEIGTSFGGHVVLIGASIDNGGTISTTGGHTALAAASSVDLVDSGVPNLTVRITGAANTVTNLGSLLAPDGGTIDVLGGIVNQEGIVRAEILTSFTAGRVSIRGQEGVTLASQSRTDANGGRLGSENPSGGAVTVESANGTVTVAGHISAASGDDDSFLGDGGTLLVRGKSVTVTADGELSVAGFANGGTLGVEAPDGVVLVQGGLSASGITGSGGNIEIRGRNVGIHGQAVVDVSGYASGGSMTIDRAAATPAGATSSVYIGPNALLQANADDGGGGSIDIGRNSDATRIYGTLDVSAGVESYGGSVQTSGQFVDVRPQRINLRGQGQFGGSWTVNAGNITLAPASATTPADTPDFAIPATLEGGSVTAALVSEALTDGADVTLRAGFAREAGPPAIQPGNILVASNIFADDARSSASLYLEAYNAITLAPGVSIESNAAPLYVSLLKDMDANDDGSIQLGAGSRISTAGGHVRLSGTSRQSESFVPVPSVVIGGDIDTGTGWIDIRSTSLELDNASLSSAASGVDAIYITAREFSSTGSTLTANNGRWLMSLASGANFSADSLADLAPDFVQVNLDPETGPGFGGNGVVMADSLAVRARVDAGREYDGSTDARFSEVLASDAPFGFRYETGSDGAFFVNGRFQDKNVGSDKPVGYDGESLPFRLVTSTGAPVYGADTSLVADITARPLALSNVVVNDKVYDTTRTGTVNNLAMSNVVEGDNLVLSDFAALFDTKDAGTGKTVVVTASSLQGADAFNYTLPGPVTTTADITPAPVTVGRVVGADKVYDGTRDAAISSVTYSGVLGDDDLALVIGEALFGDKNVGTNKPIAFTPSLSGIDARNYVLVGDLSATASITPRTLVLSNLGADDKVYDGTRTATVNAGLSNVVAGDDLALGRLAGLFDTKNAGIGKTVTVTAAPLQGLDASNYVLPGATTSADITPRPITVQGVAGSDKVYDGTRLATVAGGTFSGALDSDDVTLGTGEALFDDKNVGTNKRITFTGSLGGADAPNYVFAGNLVATGSITPRLLGLANLGADNKVYDATRAATVNASLSNVVAGDDVALGGLTGLFDTKHAGIGKTVAVTAGSLRGADAVNYTLADATTRADITPRPITAQGIVGSGKVYDGTRLATVAGGSFSGVLEGDDITVGTGDALFDDKNVGTNKQITFTGRLGGADAPNYVFSGNLVATGSITPRALALSNLGADNKVYDATRAATVRAGLANVVAGDDVALDGLAGLFDTKNAGTGKTVAVTVGSLRGADAGNYTLPDATPATPATTTADIAPRPITAEGIVGADKVYDGTQRAFLSASSVFAGRLGDDDLKFGTSDILFDDKNVGTNKLITFTSSIMTGADAPNYVLVGPLTARGSITPRALEIGIAGPVSKVYDAGTGASLRADQYLLNGAVANDVLTVSGPSQGVYDSPNVGQQKGVTVSGNFAVGGADARNYRIGAVDLGSALGSTNAVAATASGNVGAITPATLFYQAAPAVRTAGLPLSGFDGSVTGLQGADTLGTATTGTLLWSGAATPQSPPGRYAIDGSGLAAANYVFAQAPGNVNALLLEAAPVVPPVLPPVVPPVVPPESVPPLVAAPVAIARESNTASFNTALHAAVAAIDPPGIAGGVFDISGGPPGRGFTPVRIGSMNQNELAAMLDARRDFKRKLFADAIYKLEIDPSLANVQPCATVVEAASGACRITRAQLDLAQAGKAQPAAPTRKSTRNANLPQIERKIALFIGINEYQDNTIPRLENALPDVDALARLFADKLGYEVQVLRNPGKADIVRSLNQLSLEVGSSDSVVVYYAGHGYSLEKDGAGYWLPADALASDPRKWISNGDIAQLLAGVRSQQMALISDSCYSGAFARDGMDAVGVNVSADDVLTKRSVVVLSSGGDEPVADEGKDNHSIFAWNLMQVVNSVSKWKPGSSIFTEVQAGVKKEFPQTPKYGSVTAAGHQRGGDYLFELR